MPRLLELILIFVTLPFWGGLIALIALCMLPVRPIFFLQQRPGLHGKPFTLIKFRTMRAGGEPDAMRLTWWGNFLRKTSLDELPELINVLMGEMALVGPRPLLMEYLEIYTPEEHHRHDVRPGITGLAQINGRTDLTLQEKVQWDLRYLRERSIALDFKILFLTLFHLKGV